ncbi:hypothetical protein LTR86_005440 [Recurvomyces mirabilis]|nr:hypothetical protein LTR86_005440 [Recurvomyces mirabilis]
MSDSQDTVLVDEGTQDDAEIIDKSLKKLELSKAQPSVAAVNECREFVIYRPPRRTFEVKSTSAYKQKLITHIINFFNSSYGRNAQGLEAWRRLCVDLEVNLGDTIKECKENLEVVFINIVDFYSWKELGHKKCDLFKTKK